MRSLRIEKLFYLKKGILSVKLDRGEIWKKY